MTNDNNTDAIESQRKKVNARSSLIEILVTIPVDSLDSLDQANSVLTAALQEEKEVNMQSLVGNCN